jgi:hypothetical protein
MNINQTVRCDAGFVEHSEVLEGKKGWTVQMGRKVARSGLLLCGGCIGGIWKPVVYM